MEKSNIIEALAALAHEVRLDVFRLLVQQGPQGVPAGDIAAKLHLPAATLSFHLNALRHAGLVSNRREGRQIFYTARYQAISELMAYLMENCCQGHPQACAFLDNVRPRSLCEPAGITGSSSATGDA
ncbi:MAG TPA: metalloregulator ArsR/SmtB family transcription factor [Gammaproteobacteria bacterium]|nr:metalloregulator ArsR/SmtB family transcription factor [Gammaproteobacteria bacterium]